MAVLYIDKLWIRHKDSKDIYIKMTEHISKLGENVDPGNDKIADEELEPNAAGKLKDNDNESEGVKSEVGNTTKDANGKDADSPHSDLVKVGTSFVYTVD